MERGAWIPAFAGMTSAMERGAWIPAFAGMTSAMERGAWIPAFAGMTSAVRWSLEPDAVEHLLDLHGIGADSGQRNRFGFEVAAAHGL